MPVAVLYRVSAAAAVRAVWRVGCAATSGLESRFGRFGWMSKIEPLPYAEDALAPTITANTLGYHYGKHHKGYVDNLNKLIAGTPRATLSLERLIAETAGKADEV